MLPTHSLQSYLLDCPLHGAEACGLLITLDALQKQSLGCLGRLTRASLRAEKSAFLKTIDTPPSRRNHNSSPRGVVPPEAAVRRRMLSSFSRSSSCDAARSHRTLYATARVETASCSVARVPGGSVERETKRRCAMEISDWKIRELRWASWLMACTFDSL